MNSKKLQKLAKKIAALEKESRLGKNLESIEEQIMDLTKELTLEEMLIVDDMVQNYLK